MVTYEEEVFLIDLSKPDVSMSFLWFQPLNYCHHFLKVIYMSDNTV